MDAHESDHKTPDENSGTAGPEHRHVDTRHSWNEAARPKPIPAAPLRPSAHPLTSMPPEAFGRGVLENAPEAFGCPDARQQGEDEEGKEEKKKKNPRKSKDGNQPDDDEDGEKESKNKDADEKSGDKKDYKDGDKKSSDRKDEKEKKDEDDKEPKKPPFYKRPIPMIILAVVLVLAIVGAIIYWLYARQFEKTDDAFINGHIIAISPNVSATVASVHIDDNWVVKRGQLLVELDPRDYQAVVDQMTANITAARDRATQANVQLDASRAGITDAQAQVTIAQTNAENAALNFNRYAALSMEARSQEQLDNAIAAHRSADAQVEQAKARLATANANEAAAASATTTAGAEIKVAQANLQQAMVNLGYCRILAPEDGMITRKDVEPGSYVEKGQPLFSIVPLDTWVVANFKETQLLRIRINQPATVEIDALGGKTFQGHVDSIQNGTGARFSVLPAENATGNWVKIVQRVPVKIILDNTTPQDRQNLLSPGLSVEAKIKVR